ncbi:unnamed protein product, partial [Heterotrigona itama]
RVLQTDESPTDLMKLNHGRWRPHPDTQLVTRPSSKFQFSSLYYSE